MEAKLMPAEVEVERAETIAEPLLNFAEAALAAGQAAAEATATPKAKAKTKEKESSKPAKKKGEKHELPTAEVVALAAKHAAEAAVNLQGVQKLLDQKRSNQKVLFSTPMKKVLEKVETRIKTAQKKLDRIKIAQKELRERETSTALVSDVAEKMDSVAKAIKEAKTAVDEAQGEEEEALKTAGRAAALAKVAISMKLLEVKRFTAEAGIQAQRSLQEHQQTLQGSLAEIEVLKKKAAEQKEVSKRKEANRKVAEAEALAEKADQTSAPIFDDEKLATMSALDIRQAGDVNQKAYKETIDAVNQAQRMITMLQIEAKNKENAAELAAEYAKLQARLRQAEANVSHCASLPEPVQKQLVLKGFIDEVESKVKAAEGKVETAEQLGKEAEEKPLPEQEEPAVPQVQKATAAKSAPWSKGKGGGKRDEKEVVLGPVDKAKAAMEVAKMDLKLALRFLEAHTQQGKLPEEEAADLRERIEVARTRLDVVSASVERAAEKKGILQLLGDADKKVLEAEKAVEAAADLAAPLQELMAGEDKKPGKSSGEKTTDDGKADDGEKNEADDTKEEEKVKDEEIKAEEDGEEAAASPLEEALAAMNATAQAASRQLSNAKTTLAVKRISAKRLPGNAPAACLEQLDALQKRLDAAMRRLAEVRRGSTDRQYAKARKAMAQSIELAEAKVEASKEAFQALMDLAEDSEPLQMQSVLSKAAAAQTEATTAIQAARVPLVERLQKAKADGVTTDTSEVLKEFQEMFAKLAPLQTKLDEQRKDANDKEHRFVATCLMQEASEMFKVLDAKLEKLHEAATMFTASGGQELQALVRLGHLLEVLRRHAAATSKTPSALFAELAKASGETDGCDHLMPAGIVTALKSLQPELPDLSDLLGTEEEQELLPAAVAQMDVEASAEDSGISPEKFEEHMKLSYLCVAVVTMTSEREVGSTTVRKLEVNEVLEALGVARREPQSGLVRVECKAKDDARGFVTVAGSGGTTYLEVYTPFMACVRTAEEALADSYESVSQTVAYLKQKHDELRSTRGAAALQDLKEQLQNLRVRGTRAQVAHSDVKNKVAEAKNRHERQLEALKKKRQQAEEKITADTITGEASSMVDDLIAKVTAACAEATNVLSNCTGTGASSAGSLQALEQVEKDLQSAVEACQEGEAKIMKTVMEEIRNASKGPLFDARKVMFRLKVKLSPLPNNCKKHLRTIEEKKKEVLED
ncbi:epi-1, partial [Symbiodinium sp. CCMP2456]